MIHLDANFLIYLAAGNERVIDRLQSWSASGEEFACSSLVWHEFMSGPLSRAQIDQIRMLIEDRILPFGKEEAERASVLFNHSGRKRRVRYDCLIAAAAISANAAFATENQNDFLPFVSYGLRLI